MTSAQDLVGALADAGLLKHLSEDEQRQLQSRSTFLVFDTPHQTINFLGEIPDLIWYFRNKSKENLQQKLLSITRQTKIPEDVLKSSPSPEFYAEIDSINARLKKHNQPYRYYFLMEPDDGENGPNMLCALIFLHEDQRFRGDWSQYVSFDYHRQRHTWTENRAHRVFNILTETGLLSDLDEPTIQVRFQEVITEINDQARYYEGDFFAKFELSYEKDAELDDTLQNEYQKLLADLVNYIDHPEFQPTNLKVVSNSHTDHKGNLTYVHELSFEMNDEKIAMTLGLGSSRWLDTDFIRALNKQLSALGIDRHLYTLEAVDQIIRIICLSQNQYEQLKPYFSLQVLA